MGGPLFAGVIAGFGERQREEEERAREAERRRREGATELFGMIAALPGIRPEMAQAFLQKAAKIYGTPEDKKLSTKDFSVEDVIAGVPTPSLQPPTGTGLAQTPEGPIADPTALARMEAEIEGRERSRLIETESERLARALEAFRGELAVRTEAGLARTAGEFKLTQEQLRSIMSLEDETLRDVVLNAMGIRGTPLGPGYGLPSPTGEPPEWIMPHRPLRPTSAQDEQLRANAAYIESHPELGITDPRNLSGVQQAEALGEYRRTTRPGTIFPLVGPYGEISGFYEPRGERAFPPPPEGGRRVALPAGIQKTQAQEEAGVAALTDLERLFDPSFVGPQQYLIHSYNMMVPEGLRFGDLPAGYADFAAAQAALKNDVIKLITGAQVGKHEADRISKQIPELWNPPDIFQARLRQTKKNRIGLLEWIRKITGVTPGRPAPAAEGRFGPVETRTLKTGETVRVRKNLDTGEYEEVP